MSDSELPNYKYSRQDLYSSALSALKRNGLGYVIKQGIKYGSKLPMDYLMYYYNKTAARNNTFEFQGRKYNYFFHVYGTTWKNERAVEIPIVWQIVNDSYMNNKNVLEVGNVLSYRFRITHDVLDKYEHKQGIINEDIINFKPSFKYDTIVSISTLEHVGRDETPRDETKVLRAVHLLRSLLISGGIMIVTLPIGQNPVMDRLIIEGELKFKRQYYMKRLGHLDWKQVDWDEVKDVEYDFKIPSANGIIIGID